MLFLGSDGFSHGIIPLVDLPVDPQMPIPPILGSQIPQLDFPGVLPQSSMK
jgi:hypothetical protein